MTNSKNKNNNNRDDDFSNERNRAESTYVLIDDTFTDVVRTKTLVIAQLGNRYPI